MNGNDEALNAYEQQVASVYASCLENRTTYYVMEQRWNTQPFWAARSE